MKTLQMSLSELRQAIGRYGYSLAKLDSELEAYPKGQRGDKSIFEDEREGGRFCLLQTVKACAAADFRAKLERLPITDETKDALVAWFESHGTEWRDELERAWYNGNYGYSCADSGTLQRLRNTNGHAVIARIR